MRIVLNGWFIDQPDTGSGQYTLQLLKQLPRVAPQHEYAVVIPSGSSFEVVDVKANAEFSSLLSDQILRHSVHPVRRFISSLRKRFSKQTPPTTDTFNTNHAQQSLLPIQRPRSDFRKILFEQSIMPRAASAYEADVLHIPYWAPPLRSSVPIVVTIHDIIPLILPQYRGGALVRAYTQLVSAAARGATLILTDSDASRNDIMQHLRIPTDRVRTIYLAADPEFTDHIDPIDTAALRKNYDLPDEYVLYLGGCDARKNVETLLQVYTWAQDTLSESYPLVFAGGLPDRHDEFFHDPRVIAKQIDVEDVVRFIGHVAEEDKVALYQQARAFLYPTLYEGFGLPALEALACGVPVVGSNASSVPEIVGDAGILVEPKDARAMAGALIAVCTEDSLHDELSERALKQAARFSWERCARETVAAYESVMHKA
ncbi:MAG TPA: glycosyltransferase family 1 protein [Anaerolineae bacterium]|nr:glycosyltransferase family 1 protein [Anaerolineae bacterium]